MDALRLSVSDVSFGLQAVNGGRSFIGRQNREKNKVAISGLGTPS